MASAIDALATRQNYADHIFPIWRALPEQHRGTFYVSSNLATYAAAAGIPAVQGRVPTRPNIPILVAAFSDLRAAPHRPVILQEHGSGQTYSDSDDGSYAGGRGRDSVVLFLCPSERIAALNLARYPSAHAAVVGCPKLDPFLPAPPPRPLPTSPIVVFSTHANIHINSETRSGARHFLPAIPILLAAGYRVVGTAHPRIYSRLRRAYDHLGIDHTDSFDEVLRTADSYVVDNSSSGFEFYAAHQRGLVWCSPPHYRRDVHHGLRFWDALILGGHATTPEEVPAAVAAALTPPSPELAAARDSFIRSVYHHLDGRSSTRAAAAIVAYLEGRLEDLDALDRDPDDGSVAGPVDLDLRPSP